MKTLRLHMSVTAASALMYAFLIFPSIGASAQEATPTGLPATPSAEECTVAPRSVAELRTLLATPVAATPASAAGPTPFAPLPGKPADAAATAAFVAAIRAYDACGNAGDYLAVAALQTDELIRRSFFQPGVNAASIEATLQIFAATPTPLAEDRRVAILGVRDVRVLEEGALGAIVRVALPPALGGTREDYYVFVKAGDHYQLAGIVLGIHREGLSDRGTPTP